LLNKPSRLLLHASEAYFRLLVAATEGATAEIGMENVIDLGSVSREFQFAELGQQVGEFVSRKSSAITARRSPGCRRWWRM
jgi:hypothetical protein